MNIEIGIESHFLKKSSTSSTFQQMTLRLYAASITNVESLFNKVSTNAQQMAVTKGLANLLGFKGGENHK